MYVCGERERPRRSKKEGCLSAVSTYSRIPRRITTDLHPGRCSLARGNKPATDFHGHGLGAMSPNAIPGHAQRFGALLMLVASLQTKGRCAYAGWLEQGASRSKTACVLPYLAVFGRGNLSSSDGLAERRAQHAVRP